MKIGRALVCRGLVRTTTLQAAPVQVVLAYGILCAGNLPAHARVPSLGAWLAYLVAIPSANGSPDQVKDVMGLRVHGHWHMCSKGGWPITGGKGGTFAVCDCSCKSSASVHQGRPIVDCALHADAPRRCLQPPP